MTEKIRELTENDGLLTAYNAEQMLMAVQHLSEYLYSKYKKYNEIEMEALQMSESTDYFSILHFTTTLPYGSPFE